MHRPKARGIRLRTLVTAAASLVIAAAQAQLTVSSQTDLNELAHAITGPGVAISNPEIDCHSEGYGEFQYSGALLGIDQGVLLTTGKIENAIGPNDEGNTTYQQGTGGSSILNIVTGRTTKDACKFEFDVIPTGDSLRFDFVFGSEEYNEWVGSQYNDVFGFFISGPGITGDPGIGNDKNIALVPGTNDAVTINNVNNGSNSEYYTDNAGGQYIQYDGITHGLSAFAQVQPCTTYHLKLIVADASDRKYDSGVFIAQVKSNPVTMQMITVSGDTGLVEGCNAGSVRFTRQTTTDQPLTLSYYLTGSATNGTDYTAIGDPDPGIAKSITIPANAAYVDQPVDPIADGVSEGTETLKFILGNPLCPGATLDSLVVELRDSIPATIQPASAAICQGGQVQLNATGGMQYTWSPGTGLSAANIPGPLAQPDSSTTYSVLVERGACSRTLQSLIQVSHIMLAGNVTAPLCNGTGNGAINLSVSGGVAPYSFQWSGPNGFTASTEDLSNIPSGTYSVTVSDAACTKTQSFNVAQPAPLSVALSPAMLVFGQNIACNGGSDGSIDATVTGGTGPYTASWTGPNGFTSSLIDIDSLVAGTYTLGITDAGGCTASAVATLLQATPLVANISATTDVACAGDGSGSATVVVSGGTPNYSYAWNSTPAQTGSTATGLAPDSYTVTVTDQYGCTTNTAATINGPTEVLSATLISKTNVHCFGSETGSATVDASGGTAPYTYSWNTTPAQNGPNATGLPGGTWTVTVTDAHGCSTTLAVTIASPAQALASGLTSQVNEDCFGTNNGSAVVNASGGTGPYAYSWNTVPPQNSASATGLSAGTWAATVTDVLGCSATQEVTITGPSSGLSANITSSGNPLCAGGNDGSATVLASGGTGPYNYTWNTTPAQTTSTANGLVNGTWTVNVSDANNCTTSATATITAPSAIGITGTVDPALCQGAANGAVDLSTSGGTAPYSWAWSGPGGYTATSEDVSTLIAGGYSVTMTDAHGCSASQSFDVNQPGLFTVNATAGMHGSANVSCPGSADGSIELTVSGAVAPYNYAWSGPGGFASTDEDISGLAAGSYSVAITDVNGCSTSANVNVLAPDPISITLTASDHNGTAISCSGSTDGIITTTIGGGNSPYSTAWTGPSGFTSTQSDLSGLAAGTYTLTVTDANNCTASSTIVLDEPVALAVSNAGTVPQACYGSSTGQATASASGGTGPYAFTWNTSPVQHTPTASGLTAGTYTVMVADANGCSASTDISVDGPSAPLAVNAVSVTDVLCNMGQDGAATVQATGGTAPYSYVWNTSPQVSGATANGLAAGTWTSTATDANGCSAAVNVAIDQPAQPLAATLINLEDVTCSGDSNGTASLSITGGSGSYNVTWNTTPPQTGSTVGGLAPGTYTASIADVNGCTNILQFTVVIGGPLVPLTITYAVGTFAGGGNVSCAGSEDGSIDASVSGGTAPYNFFWSDGQGGTSNTEDLSGLSPGTYQLSVGDNHGCVADTVITLIAQAPIAATADIQSAICHGDSTGAIDLGVTGGASPYSYQWSGPAGFTAATQDLSLIPAGVYFASITDANGCQATQPFDVTQPGTFVFDATIGTFNGGSNTSCAGSTDGSIDLSASGGTSPYGYAWTGPAGYTASTANISGLAAGTYDLVLTDDFGCSALYSAVLNAPAALYAFTISNKDHGGYDLSCASSSDGELTTNVFGGTPPYTYAWTGPNGFTSTAADLTGLEAGTYTLTVSDANGCSVTTSTMLVAPPALAASASLIAYPSGSNISCAGTNDGAITISPTGGTLPLSVAWSGPSGFNSSAWQITGLAPGTYTALVTDLNGCSLSIDTTLIAPAAIALTTSPTDAACHAGSTGAIDLNVLGGSPTYTYAWTGPGVFTDTTQDVSNAPAGTYSVTVTDLNGCSATGIAIIAEPAAISADADVITASCQGGNSGAIDLTLSGGTPGYTYLWSGFPAYSATTQDISSLFAGTYAVTITDANGCTANANYNVNEPGLFDISAVLGTYTGGYNESCATATDGSIDASVTGGSPGYTYFWNGPAGFTSIDQDLTGVAPGAYTLTVHDLNGCNASEGFTLTAPDPIQIGLSVPTLPGGGNTSCSGSPDGSIDATITGGVPPYTITWTGPTGPAGATEDLSGLAPGTYSMEVTDALNCTSTVTTTLTGPANISAGAVAALQANGYNLNCAGNYDGSIDLTVTGGVAPFTIAWTGPNGFATPNEDLSDLAAGLYTALITDANGCTASAQADLTAPPPIDLGITTSQYSGGYEISCADAADGTLSATITGGSPGYQVMWTGPGGFTSDQYTSSGLAPGQYTLAAMDTSGCQANTTITLAAPPPVTASAVLSDHNGYEVGCSGNDGTINLTVGGGLPGYQIDWTGPNGFASQNQNLQNLEAGTYLVTVTDGHGCSIQHAYTLNAAPALTASLDVTSNPCAVSTNGAIDLTVNGGIAPLNILWNGPDGFTSPDADITGLASGHYVVVITSATGCTVTDSADIATASPMLLSLYASSYGAVNIPCKGDSSGTVNLAVQGGNQPLDIAWTGPGGFTADTSNLTGLVAGMYNVQITDANGCTADTAITLSEPDSALAIALSASLYPSGTNIACQGNADGSIDATVSGGNGPFLFDWRGPDSTSWNTEDLTGVAAGDYELVVTDLNQCNATVLITLTEPDSALQANFSVSDHNGYNTTCADSADGAINLAVLGGSPGYNLAWSGPDGFTSPEDSITGLTPGTYTLTATDVNGCALSQQVEVEAPPAITPVLSAATFASGSNISCAGMNDGAITAAVTGGVPELALTWSGPDGFNSTNDSLSTLAPGTYCLTVTDANGCEGQACATLIAPDTLAASANATSASCGSPNGAVQSTVTGGGAPYAYLWNGGQQTAEITGVPAGNYSLIVTDANGCMDTTNAAVAGSPAVDAGAETTDPLCHDDANGSINLTVDAGTAPYTYLWNGDDGSEDLADAAAGTYSVTVTDANGCTWQGSYDLVAPDEIGADTSVSVYADGFNISSYGGNDGSIAVDPTGGTPPYSYSWSNGASSPSLTGLSAGTYTVTITDAHGCSRMIAITLTAPDVLEMPSGFTPNGDGQNDAFIIHGIDGHPNNQLTIFNRWGNVVFDQLNYANDWRGENQQGQALSDGTYFAVLKLGNGTTLQHFVDLRR